MRMWKLLAGLSLVAAIGMVGCGGVQVAVDGNLSGSQTFTAVSQNGGAYTCQLNVPQISVETTAGKAVKMVLDKWSGKNIGTFVGADEQAVCAQFGQYFKKAVEALISGGASGAD